MLLTQNLRLSRISNFVKSIQSKIILRLRVYEQEKGI